MAAGIRNIMLHCLPQLAIQTTLPLPALAWPLFSFVPPSGCRVDYDTNTQRHPPPPPPSAPRDPTHRYDRGSGPASFLFLISPPASSFPDPQYKRMSMDASPIGTGLLWGGAVPHPECAGYGVVYFAEKALRGRGESLMGKRCVITGSGKVSERTSEWSV